MLEKILGFSKSKGKKKGRKNPKVGNRKKKVSLQPT